MGAALLLQGCQKPADTHTPEPEKLFVVPPHFPDPIYDLSANPVTRKGFELGRQLFYDPLLSVNGMVSCGSCHIQSAAFTQHGHVLSHGVTDRPTRHNTMPIQNLAWMREFGWDGGVFHLDLFPPSPIQNVDEMGETLSNVLAKLNRSSRYRALFKEAFKVEKIEAAEFVKALSQFQLMCISADARYDRHVLGKAGGEMTALELQGKVLFEQKCATCHSGVLFTDNRYRSNGLPVRDTTDRGREEITLNPTDRYRFRVPSLRNCAKTNPYMHDGRFETLDEVIEHYRFGVTDAPHTDALLKAGPQPGLDLTDDEQQALVAFLNTLTDTGFLTNEKLAEVLP